MTSAAMRLLVAAALAASTGCAGGGGPATGAPPDRAAVSRPSADALAARIAGAVAASGAEVGVYYRSLAAGGDSVLVGADVRMHAASTMKVPVMIQLYRDADTGRLSMDGSLTVDTVFPSIVDGSPYALSRTSDSDDALYERAGEGVAVRELVERMITRSSNLATNLLIDEADASRVTATMRSLGADSIHVLRGVEDIPAFRAGLSNTTTARDLGVILGALASGRAASPPSSREMLAILERQEFREKIPAGVPAGTRVANKTGWITGIHHDAAVVFPEGAPPYVLVVLIRGFEEDEAAATALARRISEMAWTHHTTEAQS
ncbi:MAG: class A beta-lactamase-related serine hydrolase [Gemmatimonadetes bacterium]|nr:class A beta-lactamase-related serine hydrolase [Gemmatimonadota bacterium]